MLTEPVAPDPTGEPLTFILNDSGAVTGFTASNFHFARLAERS